MRHQNKILVIVFFFMAVTSCKKEEEPNYCGKKITLHFQNDQILELPKDDYQISIDSPFVLQYWDTSQIMLYSQFFFRSEIYSLRDYDLYVTVINLPFQTPPFNGIKAKRYSTNGDFDWSTGNPERQVGKYSECGLISSIIFCDWADVSMGNGDYYKCINDTNNYVEITACDTAQRIVSGKINVTLLRDYDHGDSVHLTTEFNDLCYFVKNVIQY